MLSINQLLKVQQCPIKHKQYVATQLPQCIQQMSYHLTRLKPYSFSASSYFDSYLKQFRDVQFHRTFGEAEPKFNSLIQQIQLDHNLIMDDLWYGIKSMGHYWTQPNALHLHNLLTEFHFQKIKCQTLVNHYLIPNFITQFKPAHLIDDLLDHIIDQTTKIFGSWPDLEFNSFLHARTEIVYPSSSLYYIIYELLKNSITATLNHEHSSSSKPISIKFNKSNTQIIIDDAGPPISLSQMQQFDYFTYTSSDPYVNFSGYGYGLPLSRIYCRLFGGLLTLKPKKNHGIKTIISLS